MFITDRVLDIILKAKDEAFALAIAAKDHEIEVFRTANSRLIEEIKYEKAKADGLVDRLLVRDARVTAVSPQAVEAGILKDKVSVEKFKEIEKLFDSLGDIGGDVPAPDARTFTMAGGNAVGGR